MLYRLFVFEMIFGMVLFLPCALMTVPMALMSGPRTAAALLAQHMPPSSVAATRCCISLGTISQCTLRHQDVLPTCIALSSVCMLLPVLAGLTALSVTKFTSTAVSHATHACMLACCCVVPLRTACQPHTAVTSRHLPRRTASSWGRTLYWAVRVKGQAGQQLPLPGRKKICRSLVG